MRRTLVCLAACALLTPLAAQEKVPAPTTNPTVTPMQMSSSSRMMTRRGEVIVVPGTMTTTTIVNGQTQTMTMEPVVDSRGRVRGYRQVMTPSTTVTRTETKTTETNPVTQTGNTEPKVEKSETKVTTTPTTEQPTPERRRGILSRIFRR